MVRRDAAEAIVIEERLMVVSSLRLESFGGYGSGGWWR